MARQSYKIAESVLKTNVFAESKNKDDLTIYFKNGSHITCLSPQGNKESDVVRGKRSDIKHWQCDWESVTEEMINEAIKPFTNDL